MIKKLNVEVLGVVENLSGVMFGTGAGEQLATEMNLAFLGHLALRPDYRDDTQPTVLGNADVGAEYDTIWAGVRSRLTELQAMPEQIAAAPKTEEGSAETAK